MGTEREAVRIRQITGKYNGMCRSDSGFKKVAKSEPTGFGASPRRKAPYNLGTSDLQDPRSTHQCPNMRSTSIQGSHSINDPPQPQLEDQQRLEPSVDPFLTSSPISRCQSAKISSWKNPHTLMRSFLDVERALMMINFTYRQ